MTALTARLETCFATVFPNVPSAILHGGTRETIEAWDSMAFIVLIMLIEEEFDINVRIEDIAELTSFSSIMTYLQRELALCDG